MPMPLWLGRFNTRYTNRIIGPILVWLPWFGWLSHLGRTTGRAYRTPLMLFRHGDRGVIALTYGARTQWLKNVLAAGECTFQSPRSEPIHLASPEWILVLSALAALFQDARTPPDRKKGVARITWWGILAATLCAAAQGWALDAAGEGGKRYAFLGHYGLDHFSVIFKVLFGITALFVLTMADT